MGKEVNSHIYIENKINVGGHGELYIPSRNTSSHTTLFIT